VKGRITSVHCAFSFLIKKFLKINRENWFSGAKKEEITGIIKFDGVHPVGAFKKAKLKKWKFMQLSSEHRGSEFYFRLHAEK
jgi:hypothetical protein